jgi:hypothetical protein
MIAMDMCRFYIEIWIINLVKYHIL